MWHLLFVSFTSSGSGVAKGRERYSPLELAPYDIYLKKKLLNLELITKKHTISRYVRRLKILTSQKKKNKL